MRAIQTFILLLLILSLSAPAFPQSQTGPANELPQHDDAFDIFLFAFAFVAFSAMLGIAALTVIVGGLILLAMAACIAAGIFSTALGVGIYRKSVSAGVRTALTIMIAMTCSIGGAGIAFLLHTVFQFSFSTPSVILIGMGAGIVGGLIAAAGLIWIARKLFSSFSLPKPLS